MSDNIVSNLRAEDICHYCDQPISEQDFDNDYYRQDEHPDGSLTFYHVGCWRTKWEDA